jgi:diguanylate cyclase (GGDEF)-like protein
MERLLNYERKFLNLHTNLIIAMLIYILLMILAGHANNLLWEFITIIVALHIVNFILYKFNYFKHYIPFYSLKFLQLLIISFSIFESKAFIDIIGTLIYTLLFVEMTLMIFDGKSRLRQLMLSGVCLIPIILATCVALLTQKTTYDMLLEVVFFIGIFIILLTGVIFIISEYINELYQQVDTQRGLFKEAQQVNEELRITQQKFKNAHDQLAKQNLDLEQAYIKLNRASSEMYIQNELLKYISTALEIDELMEMVTDSIIGAIGVDTCSIIIYDVNKGSYQVKFKSVLSKDYTKQLIHHLTSGNLDSFFNNSKVYTDNEVTLSQYPFLDDREVGSIIIMPLIQKHHTYGLLIAEQKAQNTFTDNIQFFEGIATQINIAINNANLYAKMEDIATRDGLTGVYNRSFLQKRFSELVSEAIMNKTSLSVALFDIDKFKRINDSYGHLFGDKAIKMTANITDKIANIHDGLVGRFGGEEFVIVLPNKNIDQALEISKTVHEAIRNEVLYHNEDEIRINVSIGVTSYPEICQNPSELLDRADLAMYYSKQNGRGRITVDYDNLKQEVNM